MTVENLIALLRLVQPDAQVCIPDYSGFDCSPDGVYSPKTLREERRDNGNVRLIIE